MELTSKEEELICRLKEEHRKWPFQRWVHLVWGSMLAFATFWFGYLFPINVLFMIFALNTFIRTGLNWNGNARNKLLLKLLSNQENAKVT